MSVTTLEHVLAVLIFLARVGDIHSTLSVTPTLKLEMNPLARRFRRFILPVGFVACFAPYYDLGLGIAVTVMLLLVPASNYLRSWSTRAIGETEVLAMMVRATRRTSRGAAIGFALASWFFGSLVGALTLFLSGTFSPGYWVGLGFLGFFAAMTFHSILFILRLFRLADREGGAVTSS